MNKFIYKILIKINGTFGRPPKKVPYHESVENYMMNVIWPAFIVISFIYAIFTGRVNEINEGIFNSASDAVQLSITFLGTICLWNGIMEIVKKTSLIKKLTKFLNPIILLLFPKLKNDEKIKSEISMNIIANILGLGNAATPLGLKAMKSMQEKNIKKDTLSDEMMMFIVLNTASLQLIPTNVIAIRTALNSGNATQIIFPVWGATIIAAIIGIIATKFVIKKIKY